MSWNYDKDPKPCLTCSEPSYKPSHWTEERGAVDKPMYFINGEGQVLFPGHKNDQPPPGFEARHINNSLERDNFYRFMDQQLRDERDKYASIEQAHFEYAQEQNRRELRSLMESMSPQERDLAMAAIEEGNKAQLFFNQNYDPGFHIEAWEYEMSNRRPHNDAETNWRDRY